MADAALDELIHPLPRISICAVLSAVDWVAFSLVRDQAGLSDSALSKHASVLADAGYVQLRKGAVGRRPRTWLRLTAPGRVAFERHMQALTEIRDRMSPAVGAPASDQV